MLYIHIAALDCAVSRKIKFQNTIDQHLHLYQSNINVNQANSDAFHASARTIDMHVSSKYQSRLYRHGGRFMICRWVKSTLIIAATDVTIHM